LKRDGNRPVCSDKLASMVIAGAKTSAQSFRRETGRTSSGEVTQLVQNDTHVVNRTTHTHTQN